MNCEIQLGNGGFILPFRQPLTFNMSHLRKQVRSLKQGFSFTACLP